MSCGNHHDKDCAEVLVELYRFVDHELDDASAADIQQHLDECGPCLQQHELDMIVQRLVARSCFDRAPQPLRDRVLLSLRQVVQVDVAEQSVHPAARTTEPATTQPTPGSPSTPLQTPPRTL